MTQAVISSPVGPLKLTVEKGHVIGLEFSKDKNSSTCLRQNKSIRPYTSREHLETLQKACKPCGASLANALCEDLEILQKAQSELDLYFKGLLKKFTVPVLLSGPPFYLKVWEELKRIGYGETKTYSEIAEKIGSPRAARAVGNACAANPVAIIIPCHRVLAKDGLGGFGGGLEAKAWLLKHESLNA